MAAWTRRQLLVAGAASALGPGHAVAQSAQPEAPSRGGTVTVAINQAPPSIDAQLTSASAARDITLHLYETLYARDESGNPVPDLAQGVDVAKDGLTYVFHLRSGVKFHNGKEMGAHDAAASLERFRKVGASANMLSAVDTVEASGPLELTIRLKTVQSTFLDTISSPRAPMAIYPAEEAAKPVQDFSFVGTGPFKFVEYLPDSHITLDRFADYVPNPNYKTRDGFAGRKEVFIDRATFRFMPEAGAQVAALQTGQVQVLEIVEGRTAKQLQTNSAYKVFKALPFYLQVGKFNHAQPPCDDVNFRRAVAAALNMEEIMAIAFPDVYDLDGGWVFANSRYYSKAGLELYNLNDAAKAKALLAKSGYKGETLTFITDNTRPDMDVATDVKEQLGQIGIKVDVKVSDWPTVSKVGFTPTGWHFWSHGFGIEPYEGPATVMSVWANGVSELKDDPVIDQLFTSYMAEMDEAKRKDIFARFQAHMYDDAVAMQFGNYGIMQAISANLQNFIPYRIPRLWGVWLKG
ncbi:MAG: ABC transporter substrate-binding protein [Acetobacteraceae bacterium]|nr:ABC transporter substrate-binding protein [Acetobacteraceae bacterium]